MAAAKYIGAGLAAIGLTGAGKIKKILIQTNTRDFFNKIFEKDQNQETNNVFIIGK
jgi:hypothetical protein